MERGGRRTHQDRAVLEWDFLGQADSIAGRHGDILGVAAIDVAAHHASLDAELLVARTAIVALAAAKHVMDANPVPGLNRRDLLANLFNHTGDLVPQCPWQRLDR